jgi:hypothetical protein
MRIYDFKIKVYKAVNYGKTVIVPLVKDDIRVDILMRRGQSFDITTEQQGKIFEYFPHIVIEESEIIVEIPVKILEKQQRALEKSIKLKEEYKRHQLENNI